MKIGYGLSFVAVLLSGAGLVACKKPSFLENESDSAAVEADSLHDSGFEEFTPPEIRRTGAESSLTASSTVESETVSATQPPPAPASVTPSAPAPKPATVVPRETAVPEPSSPSETKVTGPTESGDWTLQVGIDKSEAGANALVNRLKNKGIRAYAFQVSTGGAGLSGSYWRVRVGYFSSRAEADQFGQVRLKPMGFAPWVDRRSKESNN